MPRPIGSVIAERHADRYRGAQIADALREREDCPVCGKANGDCTRRDHVMAERQRNAAAGKGRPEGGLPGVPTEEERRAAAKDQVKGLVVVTERIYGEVPAPGGGPNLTVVRYVEGQVIPESEAKENKLPTRKATPADLPRR